MLTLADGKAIAQSTAIARFIARESNLYYTSARTAADADGILEALGDIAAPYGPIVFSGRTDEEKAAAFAELIAKLPAQLAPVKKLFKGTFFLDAPTLVDIYMTGVLRTLEGTDLQCVRVCSCVGTHRPACSVQQRQDWREIG